MITARHLIREPDVVDSAHYRRRVGQLAGVYGLAFTLAIIGIALLLRFARLFVALSQRSNVETLTILFFLLFFSYIALISMRGAWGSVCILYFYLWARFSRNADAVERRKERTLGKRRHGPSVAMNRAVYRSDSPGAPFEVIVADHVGQVGRIRVDGVKVRHLEAHGTGSNDMLAFFVRQMAEVLTIDPDELDVVSWAAIDEEGWHEYTGLVQALENLGKRSGDSTSVWPSLTLSPADCQALEARMSPICPSVRNEAFLPELELEGEHKIPIIPEPLGIISLARRERRVSPLASVGFSLFVIVAVVALLILFILRPPWVPGN